MWRGATASSVQAASLLVLNPLRVWTPTSCPLPARPCLSQLQAAADEDRLALARLQVGAAGRVAGVGDGAFLAAGGCSRHAPPMAGTSVLNAQDSFYSPVDNSGPSPNVRLVCCRPMMI